MHGLNHISKLNSLEERLSNFLARKFVNSRFVSFFVKAMRAQHDMKINKFSAQDLDHIYSNWSPKWSIIEFLQSSSIGWTYLRTLGTPCFRFLGQFSAPLKLHTSILTPFCHDENATILQLSKALWSQKVLVSAYCSLLSLRALDSRPRPLSLTE